MSAQKDAHGVGVRCHVPNADITSNLGCVTMLSTINAAGECVPPLWILKWKRNPFRVERKNDVSTNILSAAHVLPSGSLLATRREIGGIDSKIFIHWTTKFVSRVYHLKSGGRKVLLVYDDLRASLSLTCLPIRKRGGVELMVKARVCALLVRSIVKNKCRNTFPYYTNAGCRRMCLMSFLHICCIWDTVEKYNFCSHKISHTNSTLNRKMHMKIRGTTDQYFGVVFAIGLEAYREAVQG